MSKSKYRSATLEISLDWDNAVLFSKFLSEQEKLNFSRHFFMDDTEDLQTFSIECQPWLMMEVCKFLDTLQN